MPPEAEWTYKKGSGAMIMEDKKESAAEEADPVKL